MTVESAGVLLYRVDGNVVRVFVAHMGGPFFENRDQGAWTIPKGEIAAGEAPVEAAAREFEEEIGVACPGDLEELGVFQQSSHKIVHAFVAEADASLQFVSSNEFEMEWPFRSRVMRSFPEIDRAGWYDVAEARELLVRGQIQVLDALMQRLGQRADGLLEA